MVSSHYDIPKRGKVTGEIGHVTTDLNSGMAVVVPADDIKNLLTREDLVAEREHLIMQLNARTKAKESSPAYDFASSTSLGNSDYGPRILRSVRRAKPAKSSEAPSET